MTERKRDSPPRPYRRREASAPVDAGVPTSDQARRVADVSLRKIFAQRMLTARVDIAGLSQLEAARRMGFSNSSPLAKIELGASFSRTMPLVAARVYRVSTDFLLGVSDFQDECSTARGCEWQAAIINANQAFFHARMNDHAHVLARIGRSTTVSVHGLSKIMTASTGVKEAFEHMVRLNPDAWGEARGGSRLESVILDLDRLCHDLERAAARARLDLQTEAVEAGVCQ